MRRNRGGRARFGTALLALPLAAGVSCDELGDEPARDPYNNEFGVLLDALGVEIPSCVDAGAALAGTTLTLALGPGEDAVVSVVTSKLRVNGHQCLKDASSGVQLTTSNVRQLIIAGAGSSTNSVLLDLIPGAFGALFGPTGGVIIQAGNGASVSVGVRGTDGAQRFKMAEALTSIDLYLELTGDNAADVKVVGDPSSVVMSLGPGPDSFNAQDTRNLTFLGVPLTLRAVVSEPLTIYGGAGPDTLEGGNGNDTLDGGDDNDVFQSDAAGTDGADTFQGGNGNDTVDYTSRTVGVTADIDPGHTRAFVDGASLHGKTLSPGTALTLSVGGGGTITHTSAGVSGSAAILAELGAASGFAGAASASVDDRGRLVIEADAAGQAITILSDNQLLIGGSSPWTGTETDLAADLADNDDGATGADERDDVKSDIEHLKGGSGDDILTGNARSNFIDGGAGNDDLAGGPGGTCASDVDTLNGGAGDDTFQMGAASNCADAIDGAAGRDTASYELRTVAVTVALDSAANDGESENDNVKSTIEIVLGGDGGDTLTGSAASDELHGGPGNDLIKGGAGNDTLVGGTGADNLLGELGDDFFDEASANDDVYDKAFSAFGGQDVIHGGAGTNLCDYRRGTSTGATFTLCYSAVAASCAPAQNDGPDGDDLTNCTRVMFDDGADNVMGSEADDILEGGDGADTIDGGGGNDHIYGEAGDDRLAGGAGGDALDGGPDQTLLSDGGSGDDVCVSVAAGSLSCEL